MTTTLNLPRWARAAIYVLNVLGTPVVIYARAKDWIGDLELTLWGAEVAAGFTLAGLSLPAGDVELRGEIVQTEIDNEKED